MSPQSSMIHVFWCTYQLQTHFSQYGFVDDNLQFADLVDNFNWDFDAIKLLLSSPVKPPLQNLPRPEPGSMDPERWQIVIHQQGWKLVDVQGIKT